MADFEKISIDFSVENDTSLEASWKQFISDHKNEVPLPEGLSDELIDKYYDKVYDYMISYLYCKNCPGKAHCEKNEPLTSINLSVYCGVAEESSSPCKEIINDYFFQRQYEIMDFPSSWLNANRRNIDKSTARAEALRRAIQSKEWTYIEGTPRSGKSYLAVAITNEYASKSEGPIYFLDAKDRIREIASAKRYEQEDMIKEYSQCNVLVLDNFGSEFVNDYVRDAIVIPILEFRATHDLITIFTSQYSIEEVSRHYETKSQVGKDNAKKLRSILQNNCYREIVLSSLKGPLY
ncbi:MAG: ATP-binding protein [Coprobacillus sp.]|nr:ATP-binding protein [Coprobacillus sp.]